jgi:hypothetical protein
LGGGGSILLARGFGGLLGGSLICSGLIGSGLILGSLLGNSCCLSCDGRVGGVGLGSSLSFGVYDRGFDSGRRFQSDGQVGRFGLGQSFWGSLG